MIGANYILLEPIITYLINLEIVTNLGTTIYILQSLGHCVNIYVSRKLSLRDLC